MEKAPAAVLACLSLAAAGCEPDCAIYQRPALAQAGGRHLIAVETQGCGPGPRIEGVWLDARLANVGRWSLPSPRREAPQRVVAAASPSQFLVAWNESTGIWASFLAPGRMPGSDVHLVEVTPPSLEIPTAASIGFDGRSFVLGWTDAFHDPAVRVARIAPTAEILDRAGITVRAGDPRSRDRGNRVPALASSGEETLVVWGRRSFRKDVRPQLMAARLLPDGSLRDPAGIAVAEGQDLPAVAWDGAAYFVVAHEGPSWDAERGPEAPGPVVLRGTRVFPDGRVVPQPFAIEAQWPTRAIELAANGDVLLVVWNVGYTVYAARLGREGALISPGRFEIGRGDRPTVARSGDGFLVVWNDTFDSSPDHLPVDHARIWARPVGADGVAGDPVRVLP